MREYLFHGKRTDTDEWVEGSLRVSGLYENGERLYSIYAETEKPYIANIHDVLPESVGQFTGEYDQNKKRIWENDIVRTKAYGKTIGLQNVADYDVFAVVFKNGAFRLENGTRQFNLFNVDQLEVIGNLTDTPELLVDSLLRKTDLGTVIQSCEEMSKQTVGNSDKDQMRRER